MAPPSPQPGQRPPTKQRLAYVVDLRETDVLLGRGQPILSYSGNLKFRKIIIEHKEAYLACGRHDSKETIARKVLDQVEMSRGRFLSKIEDDEERSKLGVPESMVHAWRIVDEATRLKKVKQALRENLNKSDTEGGKDACTSPPRRKKARLKRDTSTSVESDVAQTASAAPIGGAFSISAASAFVDGRDQDDRKQPPLLPANTPTLHTMAALQSSIPGTSQPRPALSEHHFDGSPRLQGFLSRSVTDPTSPSSANRGWHPQTSSVRNNGSSIQPPLYPSEGGISSGTTRGDLIELLKTNPSIMAALGLSQHAHPQPSQVDLSLDMLRKLRNAEWLSRARHDNNVSFPLSNQFFPARTDPYVSQRDILPQQATWQVGPTTPHLSAFAPAMAAAPPTFGAFNRSSSYNDASVSRPDLPRFQSIPTTIGGVNVEPNNPSWMEQYIRAQDEARFVQLRNLVTNPSSSVVAPTPVGRSRTVQSPNTETESKPRATRKE